MTSNQDSSDYQAYFKISYTEITGIFPIKKSFTISEFLHYVKYTSNIRDTLNITQIYAIEIVEVGKPGGELAEPMEPSDNETLLQRYGNVSKDIAFYVRLLPQV